MYEAKQNQEKENLLSKDFCVIKYCNSKQNRNVFNTTKKTKYLTHNSDNSISVSQYEIIIESHHMNENATVS